MHKILRTFLESADGYVHQLQHAIVNGDADSLYRLAHTLNPVRLILALKAYQ